MKVLLVVLGLFLQFLSVHSLLIIPDEVPSLLSVIYSNIPTIKKGTDSRVGWGFRLGNRADFQVLVELGPQTNTQPLANQVDNTNKKRDAPNNLRDILYAQRHRNKQISNTEGGKWLDQWSQNVRTPQTLPPTDDPVLGAGEVDAKSVIPDDTTLQLRALYDKAEPQEISEEAKNSARLLLKLLEARPAVARDRPEEPKPDKDALDNVDLD